MNLPFDDFWNLLCISSPAGSIPATGFLKQSGIHMDSKGFITVNKVFSKAWRLSESVMSHMFVNIPSLYIPSSKPSPRWCRQMRMGSLLEEMLWFFLSCHATTRRWTSPTGKWLTYTVSVLQLDLEQGCLLSVRMIYMLKDKHVNVSCFQPHWQEEWQLSAWWAERLRSKLCLTSGQPCLGRPYAMQVGLPPVFGLKSACFLT